MRLWTHQYNRADDAELLHTNGALYQGSCRNCNPSISSAYMSTMLSSGVRLISKPSALQVPPWQMVSALLGGHALRTANWWADPDALPSTTASTPMGCWDPSLGKPGAVEIALSGQWGDQTLGLAGTSGYGSNLTTPRSVSQPLPTTATPSSAT
jgi:hypothetical protein